MSACAHLGTEARVRVAELADSVPLRLTPCPLLLQPVLDLSDLVLTLARRRAALCQVEAT